MTKRAAETLLVSEWNSVALDSYFKI